MSAPYFAMYPSDFLADVGHLGNTELGIYWRLLLVYYRDGKPLPFDTDRLRRLAMTFSPEEFRCLESVVSEFFTLTTTPEGAQVWRHPRADREICKANDKHKAASEKAHLAASKRWDRVKSPINDASSNAPSMLQAMLVQCQPEPEPEPSITHAAHESETPRVPAQSACPHAEILKLFAHHLPMARQPAEWTPARQAALRTRWREKRNRQNLDWWAKFFAYVAESAFLTGKAETAGRKPFLLSLDWLLKADNFLKTIEGAYHEVTA